MERKKGAAAADQSDVSSRSERRRGPLSSLFSLLSFFSTPRPPPRIPKNQTPVAPRPSLRPARPSTTAVDATSLQFIKGVVEPSVPDVSLTRSRDGSSGVATFVFTSPSIFDASSDVGDITGLYLVDDEGTLSTVDVSAKFVNGKPDRIEAKYFMRSEFEWNRFLRFMERYAEDNELGFAKKQQDE